MYIFNYVFNLLILSLFTGYSYKQNQNASTDSASDPTDNFKIILKPFKYVQQTALKTYQLNDSVTAWIERFNFVF